MSASQSSTNSTPRTCDQGWLIVDPAARPYLWYRDTLAADETAALEMFDKRGQRRAALMNSGWTIRRGSGAELLDGAVELLKATA